MSGPTFFTVVQTRVIEAQPLQSAVGTVLFTPSPSEAESAVYDTTFALQPVEGRWVNGQLATLGGAVGIPLVDNVDLNLAVGELVYRVDYLPPLLESFSFAAPSTGGVVDLSKVTRLPA